jgi:hypothetical protein
MLLLMALVSDSLGRFNFLSIFEPFHFTLVGGLALHRDISVFINCVIAQLLREYPEGSGERLCQVRVKENKM